MKIVITISLIFLCSVFTSCDPDVAGEKITLPPMEFAFKVSPDTAFFRVGDTLTLHASLSAMLSNGIKLDDGAGDVWTFISRGNDIPKTSSDDIRAASNDEDYKLIIEGGVKFGTNQMNQIRSFTSFPIGDSLIMSYKFVLLKPGVFRFNIAGSSFYEGSKGKARWSARFDVTNPNWDTLWRIVDNPTPQPSEDYYFRNYLIAVTE